MKIKELVKNHKNVVIKALKLWGSLALFFLALNIVAYLGIKGLLITLFVVMVVSFLLLIYLDFKFSLKDESFALIFRNLNHLDKKFDSIKYNQYGTIEEEQDFIRLLWSTEENPLMDITNLFTGKLNHNRFKFYNIDMNDRKGFVIECEKDIDAETKQGVLVISQKAVIDREWIKRNKYRKTATTSYFNVYTNQNKKVSDSLLEKINVISPYNEQQAHILLIQENKIVFFINDLYPFHSSLDDKKDADKFFLGEIENIKKQIERMSIILS